MEADKSNPYQLYCWEFQQSLLDYDNGNWFGRLIAYKGKIHLPQSFEYNQEDFQQLVENGGIQVIKMETNWASVNFTPDNSSNTESYQSGTISSEVEIELDINGVRLNDTFTVTHQVKPAFQTKLTNVS